MAQDAPATPTIAQALLALDGTCDGARTHDQVGFNARDAEFGKSLAAQVRAGRQLTSNQARAAYRMLRTYRKQLATRHGLDYDAIPDPDAPRPWAAVLPTQRALATVGYSLSCAQRDHEACGLPTCRCACHLYDNPGVPAARPDDDPRAIMEAQQAQAVSAMLMGVRAPAPVTPTPMLDSGDRPDDGYLAWLAEAFEATAADADGEPAGVEQPVRAATVAEPVRPPAEPPHPAPVLEPSVTRVTLPTPLVPEAQMPTALTDARRLLAVIARQLPGYEHREAQAQAMDLVAQVLRGQADYPDLLLEAGTGTGKSILALLGAAAAGVPVIVSTDTKALQVQYRQDTQNLARWLRGERPYRAAEVKGRANYLCLAAEAEIADQGYSSAQAAEQAQEHTAEYAVWRAATATGDLEDLPFTVPSALKRALTRDRATCLGKQCPAYDPCYANQALARAAGADVVVVNHSLLMQDIRIREETDGYASVVPLGRKPRANGDADDPDPSTPETALPAIILDEAHALENKARDAFGIEFTAGRWTRIVEQLHGLTDKHKLISQAARQLEHGQLALTEGGAQRTAEVAQAAAWGRLADALQAASLAPFAAWEARLRQDTKTTLRLGDETPLGAALLEQTRALAERMLGADPTWLDERERERWGKLRKQARALAADFAQLITVGDEQTWCRLISLEEDDGRRWLKAEVVPIDVAPLLRTRLWARFPHVVAMSATLASTNGFTLWRQRCGAPATQELIVAAPYDYARVARLYLPAEGAAFDPRILNKAGTPASEKVAYYDRLAGEMYALATAAQPHGGTLLLFHSTTAMRDVAARLKAQAPRDWTILVQGDAPRLKLVEQMKTHGRAILCGLKSFWEGIDIRGTALVAVGINQFPFAPPDDPLWAAQCEAVERAGGSWFADLAVPTATIALKQAFGRLIRAQTDWGVVGIFDGRCTITSYGPRMVRALPPATQTRSQADVAAFFAAHRLSEE